MDQIPPPCPSFKRGLGPGSNNFAKLLTLKLLLLFAGEKGITTLHIFFDSLNVINWVRKTQVCHNIHLLALLEENFRCMDSFDSLLFRHVYRKYNVEADKLSKEGLQLAPG